METVTIKRTTSDLPLMILVAITFLFPGLYIMSQNKATSITFILAALFTFLVVLIAAYSFVVIFRYHGFFILTKDGVTFQDNNGKKFYRGEKFCKWDDISSYRMETKTRSYYSNEMNSNQERKTYSIILTLKDGNATPISADKFSITPAEIIELFDLYKNV